MVDVRKRFNDALQDTVRIWKAKEQVMGVYVHGSFVRGTVTSGSDLDICVIWDEDEAPAQLLSDHKGVRVDMTFLTPSVVKSVLEYEEANPFRVSEVVGRLRTSEVVHDRDGLLKKWQRQAEGYKWSQNHIAFVRKRAIESLDRASKSSVHDDTVSAIYEIRNALFDLGRVIVMKSGQFCIIRPAEVLSELRLLDPIAYQLFLRTFKLKGMEEEELTDVLSDVKHWLNEVEEKYSEGAENTKATEALAQAQREYHGAMGLTMNGDYELAVLEMRRSIHSIGVALLLLDGISDIEQASVTDELREREPEFYEEILVEYGAFEFQSKAVERSIGEARFIAERL